MARRKIVFVIVEGPSDQDALELLLNRIFDSNRVFVHVAYGDITSKAGNNATNILRKVTDEIIRYANNNHFSKSFFQRVIHIVDMDGTYVSEDCIIEDETAQKTIYSLDAIKTANRNAIIVRNQIKSKNIDKLSETPVIWGEIPYSTYYMSCNLDHVLYNKQNSSDDEKEKDSYRFARKYEFDIEGFKEFISNSDFSVGGDYISSWKYIRQEKHSLERHTNLSLCFPIHQ